MPRYLVLCLSLLTGFCTSSTWAVGMGEIDLDSALNERFSGEITLINSSGLEATEILVSLGSTEDFRRVGVERFFYLTDLKFEVARNRNGTPIIKISSGQPITEPYLNFLVEVLWPNGRMLKEFTVLLDPPTFSAAAPASVRAPSIATGDSSSGQVERGGREQRGTQVQLRAPKPSALGATAQYSGDRYGLTDRDDTLWKIARASRPNDQVSINQNMLAIQRLNPKAFINNNINLLKAGYELKLPDQGEIQQLTVAEARQEVSLQTQDWQAFRNGEQVAARPPQEAGSALKSPLDARDTGSPAATTPATDGQLKIVSGNEQGVGSTQSGEPTQDPAALIASKEEGERLAREVEELSYQLDRQQETVNNDIAVRDRQIEVKDQKIAQLEEQLRQAREAAQTLASESQSDSANQNQSTTEPTPWWLTTTAMIAAGGVLILALIGGLVFARRRREDEEEFARAEELYESEETGAYGQASSELGEHERQEPALGDHSGSDDQSGFDDEDSGDELEQEDVSESLFDEEDTEEDTEEESREQTFSDTGEHEATRSQTTDVLGEADIYIAYGRYPQAIELLAGVLADEPDRSEVRLKLLELYVETNERSAFDEQLVALVDNCEDDAVLSEARDLETQFSGDGNSDNILDMAELDESASVSEEVDTLVEETLENTATVDDFDLDLELEEGVEGTITEVDVTTTSTETDLFELELDEENTSVSLTEIEQAVVTEEGDFADDLGGDLGIDFDPDSESGDTIEISTLPDGDEMIDELTGNGVEEEDFDFDDAADGANTKLDLARAYIDMGDQDGARDILNEVVEEGNDEQQKQATNLLDDL